MERKKVLEIVRRIITSCIMTDNPEYIREETKFSDMNIDSLDKAEVIVKVEERFKVHLTWDDWENVNTVGEMVDFVMKFGKL